ncbi:hypothetical protein RQP46_003562 [Phenoliferia psychrophenolica]
MVDNDGTLLFACHNMESGADVKPTPKRSASAAQQLHMGITLSELRAVRTRFGGPVCTGAPSKVAVRKVAARRLASEDRAHFLGFWRRSCKVVHLTSDLKKNGLMSQVRELIASLREDIMPQAEAHYFAACPDQFRRLMELWVYQLWTCRALFIGVGCEAVISPLATTYLPAGREFVGGGLRLSELGVEIPMLGGQLLTFDAHRLRHVSGPITAGLQKDRTIVVTFLCRNTIPKSINGKSICSVFFEHLGAAMLLDPTSAEARIIYSECVSPKLMKERILARWEKWNFCRPLTVKTSLLSLPNELIISIAKSAIKMTFARLRMGELAEIALLSKLP